MTVTVLPGADPWWGYAVEVLEHTRIPYRVAGPAGLDAALADTAVLVAPWPVPDPVDEWARAGGVVVACAGAGTVAGGRVQVLPAEPWPHPPDVPLRAFGGVRLAGNGAVLARWCDDGAPAIVSRTVGTGTIVVLGVDIWRSIVRIQQGWPVRRDGIPAPDGTAPVDDGVRKADDGIALSYVDDRAPWPVPEGFRHELPPRAPAPIFHRAHADLWRELFLHCLWWGAERRGRALPWLFYWPAGVPAVGHMSHDSDGNRDADAEVALDTFAAAGVPVTWCHLAPGGYSPATMARITAAGHEHAMHFDALDGAWTPESLRAQHEWAQRCTGARITTNKNHYTRWEGWTEFHAWCERLGIRTDQSRGPSKQGNVGFPFGTCHLSRPTTETGQLLDVFSMPLHTQDLWFFAHPDVRDPILDEVLARHGLAHFLFHGANLNGRPPARQAVLDLAHAGRARGMPWWTAARITAWEQARRGIHLTATADRILITAETDLPDAAILLAAAEWETARPVIRHGRRFRQIVRDLPRGHSEILIRP